MELEEASLITAESLESVKEVEEFLEGCSKYTRRTYKSHLVKFFDYLQENHKDLASPAGLLSKTEKELSEVVTEYARWLKKEASIQVSISLNKQRKRFSPNTIKHYLAILKTFFDFHSKPLAWKRIKRLIPEDVHRQLHVYIKEEIMAMLQHADLREKAMILLMLSSGVRAVIKSE